MKTHNSLLKQFLPFFILFTASAAMVYGTAQQVLRQTSNDPQVQLAEDTAVTLSGGVPPESLVSSENKTDISKSLAPFLIIQDETGKVITLTASAGGADIKVPNGVLDYAKVHNGNRVTWEPKPGVRAAIVVSHYSSSASKGFVIVGRSLRETENRVKNLGLMLLVGWSAVNVFMLVLFWIMNRSSNKNKDKDVSTSK